MHFLIKAQYIINTLCHVIPTSHQVSRGLPSHWIIVPRVMGSNPINFILYFNKCILQAMSAFSKNQKNIMSLQSHWFLFDFTIRLFFLFSMKILMQPLLE